MIPAARQSRAQSLKDRARDLLAKALSVKMLIFLVGTGLLIAGKITEWVWVVLASAVMGIRTVEKKPWEGQQ